MAQLHPQRIVRALCSNETGMRCPHTITASLPKRANPNSSLPSRAAIGLARAFKPLARGRHGPPKHATGGAGGLPFARDDAGPAERAHLQNAVKPTTSVEADQLTCRERSHDGESGHSEQGMFTPVPEILRDLIQLVLSDKECGIFWGFGGRKNVIIMVYICTSYAHRDGGGGSGAGRATNFPSWLRPGGSLN